MTDTMEIIGGLIIIFAIICAITVGFLAWNYWKVALPRYEERYTEGDVRVRFLIFIVPTIILSALISAGFGCLLIAIAKMTRSVKALEEATMREHLRDVREQREGS